MAAVDMRRLGALLEAAKTMAAAERWCPHTPTERQQVFLDCQSEEVFFGGSAGGGKSNSLLMAALEYVHVPDYSAIIFRRTYPELAQDGGLIQRAHEWLGGTSATWSESKRVWTFPSGATLRFGHMQNEKDKYLYQGGAWQFIGFDELTHFSMTQYTYLASRLRRDIDCPVPLRLRGASNPGGVGHYWVKARFVDPGTEGLDFIPAKLDDNPHLDREAYRRQLAKLDETTRRQLEDGEWLDDSQGLVYPLAPKNLVRSMPAMDGLRYVLGIDLGASESKPTTAFCVLAYHPKVPEGVWIVDCYKRAGMIPSTIAEEIRELQGRFGGFGRMVMDEGALGKGYGNEIRRRHRLAVEPAEKANKLGYRKLLRGALESGHIHIVEPTCEDLVEEAGSLIWDEHGRDNARGLANHCTDAMLYGWRACSAYLGETPDPRPAPGSREYREQQEREMEEADVAAHRNKGGRWWAKGG